MRVNKIHDGLKKPLKLKKNFCIYHLIILGVLIALVVVPFYYIGKSDGYANKNREINQEMKESRVADYKQDLMQLSLNEVWEIFAKSALIQLMFWLPGIIVVLLAGWIIHGLFN